MFARTHAKNSGEAFIKKLLSVKTYLQLYLIVSMLASCFIAIPLHIDSYWSVSGAYWPFESYMVGAYLYKEIILVSVGIIVLIVSSKVFTDLTAKKGWYQTVDKDGEDDVTA